MLTKSDIERMDSLMAAAMPRKEARGCTPRNEEKIAEILRNAELMAAEEHRLWLQSNEQFGSSIRYQPAVSREGNRNKFPKLDRWRRK